MRTIHDWLQYVEDTKRSAREGERTAPAAPSGPSKPPAPPKSEPPGPVSTPRKGTPPVAERQVPPPVKVGSNARKLPASVRPIEAERPAARPPRKAQSPARIKQLMASVDAALQIPLPLPTPARPSAAGGRRRRSSFSESRESLINRLVDPELRLREVAVLLSVCPATIRRYANRGVLPYHRTGGNQRRFRLSDVVDFIHRKRSRSLQAIPAEPEASGGFAGLAVEIGDSASSRRGSTGSPP